MSQMSLLLVLIGLMSPALASLNLHGQPLLSGVTSYTLAIEALTMVKPTTCYITSGEVTQCRRKRGMVERPIQYNSKGKVVPSTVVGIETTPLPRDLNQKEILAAHNLFSSIDDSYFTSQNIFKQLANRRRSNVITVGDCGMSTVNIVDFLSCLGMTVQETTTLTATFTETHYSSSGYTIMTVMGCTPAGFPYLYCPDNLDQQPSYNETYEETTYYTTSTFIPTTTYYDGTSYFTSTMDVMTTSVVPEQSVNPEIIEPSIIPPTIEEETTIIIRPSATVGESIQTTILPSETDDESMDAILSSVQPEQPPNTITTTVLTIIQTTITTLTPTSPVLESPTTINVDPEELAVINPEIESPTDEAGAP